LSARLPRLTKPFAGLLPEKLEHHLSASLGDGLPNPQHFIPLKV